MSKILATSKIFTPATNPKRENLPIRIAISGKQFSGKSTLANLLLDKAKLHGYNPKRMALADPLKDLVSKGLGRADREAWQTFGTEIVRDGCEKYFGNADFWVNLYISRVIELQETIDCFICDDVRFPNEVQQLTAAGFFLVRLVCPASIREKRGQATGKEYRPDHTSEVLLDNSPADDWGLWLNTANTCPAKLADRVWSVVSGS